METPDLADVQLRVPEHVVFRSFDAETVVLNLDSGQYHGLNGTAGRMLELLGENGSVTTTASEAAAEFGQPIDRITEDLVGLCHSLLERGLLEVVGAGSGVTRAQGRAFGVALDADFDFPGLLDLPGAPAGRASLRLAPLDDVLASWPDGATSLAGSREHQGRTLGWWERHPDAGYLIGGPDYGTFLVDATGTSVRCSPAAAEPWKWQRLLVGQVLPLLSVLQGHEVFHAAVLERSGRAVALTGASGAGKSTLAAGLVEGGWRYVADDVLAIRPPGVNAEPGLALTSLRLDAAGDVTDGEIGRDDVEGARLLVDLCPTPVPLDAVLVLQRRPEASGTVVERQQPVDPRLLLAAGYNFVVPDRDRWLRQLDVCSAIASTVAVHIVTIGADSGPAATVAAIEEAL